MKDAVAAVGQGFLAAGCIVAIGTVAVGMFYSPDVRGMFIVSLAMAALDSLWEMAHTVGQMREELTRIRELLEEED